MSRFTAALGGALVLSASAMVSLAPTAANALTYISQLEYRDGLTGAQTPYGTVKLEELDSKTVKVTVTLATLGSLFISNGGPHNPFVFNTLVSDTVTILSPVDTFRNGGRGAFSSTPFGIFTNDIACCSNHPGAAHGETPPLVFTVYDPNGLTFAGIGATFDAGGKLLTLGTGDHFYSTNDHYWFAADIYDAKTGLTYNVAAKDAFRNPAIPEPASWALMILGFGAVGAVLRRQRGLRFA